MKKLLLILFIIFLGGTLLWVQQSLPHWRATITDITLLAQDAGLDQEKWEDIEIRSESLPNIYPLSKVRKIIREVHRITTSVQDIQNFHTREPETIATEDMILLFSRIDDIDRSLQKIDTSLASLPLDFFEIGESEREKIAAAREEIAFAQQVTKKAKILRKLIERAIENESRLLILLQNQNEPRSSGGFVGSVLMVDFEGEDIRWQFKDIYALDRLVPESAKHPSPPFFADLSSTISLRDANLNPDFPATAEKYRRFFKAIEHKVPDIILAVNLEPVREMLNITSPMKLEKWGITLTPENFDTALSFLVESKIAGRWSVKSPVLDFISTLTGKMKSIPPSRFKNFPFEVLTQNMLAHSTDTKTQRQIEDWGLDGEMKLHPETDNFLLFDFISVGGNKSEKFMWTKLWHDTRMKDDGTALNTLEITRTHALHPGELDTLLGVSNWFSNVREQFDADTRWKLGEGQNRTIIRVFVPIDARLISEANPSGEITESFSEDGKFKVFDIPSYVSPGESNRITLIYETPLNVERSPYPYTLQVKNTPGRKQTTLLTTISTNKGITFRAETDNIGLPLPLADRLYQALIQF